MNSITVQSVDFAAAARSFSELSNLLTPVQMHALDQLSWPADYPYLPQVSFKIAYSASHLYVQYQVQEELVRANYMRPNENVWEDSCVEFFLSLDQRAHYYNMEFNVLGTGLIGYGTSVKKERNRLSAEAIQQVATYTEVLQRDGQKSWSIILEIPFSLFEIADGSSLSGQTVHANFYKCGDHLPTPHFVSWQLIDHPTPNFHTPQCFGELTFQ